MVKKTVGDTIRKQLKMARSRYVKRSSLSCSIFFLYSACIYFVYLSLRRGAAHLLTDKITSQKAPQCFCFFNDCAAFINTSQSACILGNVYFDKNNNICTERHKYSEINICKNNSLNVF